MLGALFYLLCKYFFYNLAHTLTFCLPIDLLICKFENICVYKWVHCTCWHDKISPTTSQPSHSDGQFHLAKAFQAHSGTSASPSPLLEQSLSLGNTEFSILKHCVSKQTECFAQVHLCSCGPLTSHTLTRTPKFQLRQKK